MSITSSDLFELGGLMSLSDPTRKLTLNLAAVNPSSTNTPAQTLTIPAGNTTMVGTDISQTLTNKTITGSTNTVEASGLRTNGAAVQLTSSNPPAVGDALVATSATTAAWTSVQPYIREYYYNGTLIQPGTLNGKTAYIFDYRNHISGNITYSISQAGNSDPIFTNLSTAIIHINCYRINGTGNYATVASVTNVSGNQITISVQNVGNTFFGFSSLLVVFVKIVGI